MAPENWEAAEILVGLMESLGLAVAEAGPSSATDLVILDVDGHHIPLQVKRISSATPAQVTRIIADDETLGRPGALRVLVADRIPDAARTELRDHGWGWLDLRGHLHLAGRGVFVDSDVPTVRGRPERTDPFSGPVGLEVACSLLLNPGVPHGVRDLARDLGRSPSTVSEVLGALRRQRLADSDGNAILPDLFWETASAWRPREVSLAESPRPGAGSVNAALQLGLDDVETQPGWALTGTLAAAAYGAPVSARSEHPPDFYIPAMAILRRATRLLGQAADVGHRGASVRVAPVPVICQQRIDPAMPYGDSWVPVPTNEPWPLANPLFVALDLAGDQGRGREILDGWQPPPPWHRVW